MSRQIFIALGGSASAILAVAFVSGSPAMLFLANLAPLPLFLVGLGYGPVAGTLAVLIGLVLSGILGGLLAAGMFGLVHAVPSWLAFRQALMRRTAPDGTVTWYPLGAVLCWLSAFFAALLVAAALIGFGHGGTFRDTVAWYLTEVVRVLVPMIADSERDRVLAALVPFFPGTAVVSWMALIAGNGLLALAILAKSGRNMRPKPAESDAVLPDWMSWLMVGAAAVALLGSGDLEYIGRNLAMITAVPFFVLGVAVVHVLARRVQGRKPLLVAFYVVLVMSVWARMAVAGLGLIEQWVGVRRRFAAANPVREDE